MLIAQALGEYGALSALSSGIQSLSIQAEDLASEWGVQGVVIVVLTIVVWKALTAVR